MLKAMLEFLATQAQQAAKPIDLSDDLDLRDPRVRRVVIAGQLHTIQDTPDKRNHGIDSVEDLIQFANRFSVTPAITYNGPSVWHSVSFVTCLIDDSDRLDMARLNLRHGSQFHAIRDHTKREGLGQVHFVRFLRFGLGLPETIIGPFRRLAWN